MALCPQPHVETYLNGSSPIFVSQLSAMVFCPLPTQYAVIHIDALAAVEHLQDPEATAAAQRFQSKLYIAYFRGVCEPCSYHTDGYADPVQLDTLPIPQRPWFRIAVDIIGRGPCADNPAERYTPEMYVPISPSAVAHPSGREPIHPNRPFPFPGCSHWVGTTTTVLVKKGKYDVLTEKGHFLKVPAERKMVNWLADDFRRSRAALYEAACDDTTSVISELSSEPTNTHCCHSPIDYDNTDKLSFSVCSCETTSYYSEDVPIDEMLFPVVDAWLELEEHITVEEMGSPLDFVKERDALVAYVNCFA